MGLSVAVGTSEEADFGELGNALEEAGLRAHDEPRLDEAACFSADMFGYSGLHYLRRVAAHLALKREVPGPGDDKSDDDPVVKEYYAQVTPEPPGLFARMFQKTRAPEKLPFQHLMLHSDAEGYYIPQDFPEVVFPRDDLQIPGGMIGSSHRLLAECSELAKWLGLPENLDYESEEVWDAAESPALDGPQWKRFGVESFSCLRLIAAAERSLKSGAAVVFC